MERARDGEFACCILNDSGHDKRRPARGTHPPGTRTVSVAYIDNRGYRVFVVQFFLYPNAKGCEPLIGASGREDPKWLWVENEGVVYQPVRN